MAVLMPVLFLSTCAAGRRMLPRGRSFFALVPVPDCFMRVHVNMNGSSFIQLMPHCMLAESSVGVRECFLDLRMPNRCFGCMSDWLPASSLEAMDDHAVLHERVAGDAWNRS